MYPKVENTPSRWLNDRKFFYKYLSLNTAKTVLKNRTLRWSTPATLNDPFDMQFDLRVDIDKKLLKEMSLDKLWDSFYGDTPVVVGNNFGAVIHAYREKFPKMSRKEFDQYYGQSIDEGMNRMERMLPEVHEGARKLMSKSKVLCLTIAPENQLMWSHYAENSRGIVLKLRSRPELDSVWSMAEPVEYSDEVPKLFDEEFLSDMSAGRVSLSAQVIFQKLTFTKPSVWAYEQEWRLCAGLGRTREADFEDIGFHTRELEAVIFGCRTPEPEKLEILSVLRQDYPRTQVMVAEKVAGAFELEIKLFGE